MAYFQTFILKKQQRNTDRSIDFCLLPYVNEYGYTLSSVHVFLEYICMICFHV